HEPGDKKVGRYRHKHMDMIPGYRTLDDFHVFCLAYLSQKIPEPFRHLSIEHLLPVFRNPDQVVLEVIHRMRSCPVVLHLLILLKSSPKRRGVFSPKGTLISSSPITILGYWAILLSRLCARARAGPYISPSLNVHARP